MDYSWQAALHMAAHDGITFGNHLIFTFGPLGFLSAPTLWYGVTGTLAVVYAVLVRVVLAGALFAGARRTYGPVSAAIVALLVASASGLALAPSSADLVTVSLLVVAVWIVDRAMSHGQLTMSMIGSGALAGFELLNKASLGIEVLALATVMALGARGRRWVHLTVMLGALVLTVLMIWTAAGQDWGALPAYARNTVGIVSGYAAALGIEEQGLSWQYIAAAVAFAFGLAGALHLTANADTRRRWGIVSLWIIFCFFEYKEGFVDHDVFHGRGFFAALMGGFLAFGWQPARRLLGFGLSAALFVFAVAAQDSSFSDVFRFGENATSGITQIAAVFNVSQRDAPIARGRAAIVQAYPIDERTLSLIGGHTAHVAPYQTAVAWAYRLHWHPLPVFQSYVVYTADLDHEDAKTVKSLQAPERILRNLDPEGGRVYTLDQGLTTLAILCRYEELRTTATWQVLTLGQNRCKPARPMATVRAGWNQSIAVPPPPDNHTVVFARVYGTGVEGIERLTALLYKPIARAVLLDGVPHRLYEATATDGLLLRAPAGVDFTPPFNLATNSHVVAVAKAGQKPPSGKPITFSFFSQTVGVGPRAQGYSRESVPPLALGYQPRRTPAEPLQSRLSLSGPHPRPRSR